MIRLFTTQFPLSEERTLEDILAVTKKWIAGSPHTTLSKDDINSLQHNEDAIHSNECSLQLGRAHDETNNLEVLGVHYTVGGEQERWYTKVAGARSSKGLDVSVVLDYDSPTVRNHTPRVKKPLIIKLLLDTIQGGRDGDICVSNKPVFVQEGEEEFVSDILKGATDAIMPTVYVSVNNNDLTFVNPSLLAEKLAGIAHVLVEPSRDFSYQLKRSMQGGNAFGGAVGVYWPTEFGRHLWTPEKLNTYDPEQYIAEETTTILRPRRLPRHITWENIQSVNNQQLMQSVREGREADADALLDLYTQELSVKERHLQESDQQIGKLEAELRRLRANIPTMPSLIETPQIDQIYQGEIEEIIRSAIDLSLQHTPQTTRRAHILRMMHQAEPSPARETMITQLKHALRGYNGLTGSMKSQLEKLGFSSR